MELTTAGQSAANLWNQDLTDILSILGDENNSISFNLSENDQLSILDVLNRALFEIRNAHDQFLQQSQGNT